MKLVRLGCVWGSQIGLQKLRYQMVPYKIPAGTLSVPYFVIILVGALGTVRVIRIFQKNILVVAMIINLSPDQTGTSRVRLW